MKFVVHNTHDTQSIVDGNEPMIMLNSWAEIVKSWTLV